MPRRLSRRSLLLAGLTGSTAVLTSGCGTILHPERRGQPAGPLDWKIVALDAVGLLLFFVPGVIAFAVDFSNGTIYLPPGHYGAAEAGESRTARVTDRQAPGGETLVQVTVPREELSRESIEGVVSAHTGRPVRLSPGECFTRPLDSIDAFRAARNELSQSHS